MSDSIGNSLLSLNPRGSRSYSGTAEMLKIFLKPKATRLIPENVMKNYVLQRHRSKIKTTEFWKI